MLFRSLPDGQTAWTEDQTRKNFDTVSKIVQAVDDPMTAKILVHPLAPEAGGDAFHSGGRQFASKNDPDWKIISAWLRVLTKTSAVFAVLIASMMSTIAWRARCPAQGT